MSKLKWPLLFLGILCIGPLVIGFGTGSNTIKYSWTKGSVDTWISFWGSYAGGVLGTFSVIIVANYQNKDQRRLLDIQIKEQKNLFNEQVKEQEKQNKITRELEATKIKRELLEELLGYYKEYYIIYMKYQSESFFYLDNYMICHFEDYEKIKAEKRKIKDLYFQAVVSLEVLNTFELGVDKSFDLKLNVPLDIIEEINRNPNTVLSNEEYLCYLKNKLRTNEQSLQGFIREVGIELRKIKQKNYS